MIFETFHGSPGSPSDFSQLEKALGHQWIHHDRLVKDSLELKEDSILIGYSWGCRELIRRLQKEKSRKVILISPFLFTQPTGFLKRIILKLPVVSKMILNKMGATAAAEFIESSSKPDTPSLEYKEQLGFLKDPEVLRLSVLEKDQFCFEGVERDHDVLVVWGELDQTSGYEKQVAPLVKQFSPRVTISQVESAGHALVWNRAAEVCEIIKNYLK